MSAIGWKFLVVFFFECIGKTEAMRGSDAQLTEFKKNTCREHENTKDISVPPYKKLVPVLSTV